MFIILIFNTQPNLGIETSVRGRSWVLILNITFV